MTAMTVQTAPEAFSKDGAQGSGRARWSRQVAVDIVGLGDAACVAAGILLPVTIYATVGQLDMSSGLAVRIGIVTAIIVHLCLRNWDMYPTSGLNDFPIRPGTLLAALTLAVLAVIGIGLPFGRGDFIHVWVWSLAWISASFVLLMLNRMIARLVLARLTAAGRFDTRIAVFGAGEVARRVHAHLSDTARGIQLVGIYDDRMGQERLDADGLNVSGKLDELVKAARSGSIDQIVIALPAAADRRMADIARQLEQLPVSVHVVTHIASDLVDEGPAHKVSNLGPVGLLDVKPKPLADWSPLLKRIEDYVLGTLLLVLALPLMALIAVAIKLDSRGPFIFRQRRRGLNQSVIDVLKFRTMTVQENGESVPQAQVDDPRVTRVGKFLRRTSLDELPQLFNVLRGEMSIVGPRPHAIAHDDEWGRMMAEYLKRHQVKPGITGLAQVRGFRGIAETRVSIENRVRNDLEYIANWSLWLDLKIIARTLWAVTTGRNAH